MPMASRRIVDSIYSAVPRHPAPPGCTPFGPKSGGNPYGKDLDKLPVGHDQGRAIDLR